MRSLLLAVSLAVSACTPLLGSGSESVGATQLALTNITATGITSSGATITWATTVTATSIVQYGLTASYGSATPMYGLTTSHSVALTGLQPGTLYHFAVTSSDASQTVTSADETFTTLGTCTPGCSGQACGAPDGCGGTCGGAPGNLPRSQMTATATSFQPGYEPSNALGANTGAWWQTPWNAAYQVSAPLPQSITLALGAATTVDALLYTPPADGPYFNGIITGYTVSVSTDGSTFTQVASGTWANDATVKTASFAAVSASFVQLTATSGANGWAAAGGLDVEAACVGAPDAGSGGGGGSGSDAGTSGLQELVGLAGKCLDASGGATANGTAIDLWDCNGTPAQAWKLVGGQIVGPGGKCLDVTGSVSTPGTPVQLWDCTGAANQQWAFQAGQLVGLGSQCLDVRGAVSTNGTVVEIWGCNGGTNQQWAWGTYSAGGSGGGGRTIDPNAFYVSMNGNDGNDGSVNAPFASLEKAQSAMQQSATRKTTYLRAGTYHRTATLNLGTADNGETWSYYPPDGVNSAVVDGAGAIDLIASTATVSNVTIDGISLQNPWDMAISINGNDSTVQHCDIGFNHDSSEVGSWAPILTLNGQRNQILYNYVHDTWSQGIGVYAYTAGTSLDGTVISGNVVLRAVQHRNDGGAIYVDMHATNIAGGHVTITNNFVRDYGAPGVQAEGIYLDDDSSNVTVSGNVIAPPSTSDPFNWGNTIMNAGCANTLTGNIIDLGTSSSQWVSGWSAPGGGGSLFFNWTGPNVVTNNVIISNYSGGVTSQNGGAYTQGSGYPSALGMIAGNLYHNYGGGSEPTNGDAVSDGNPVHADPLLSGWTYQLAAGSPAFAAPVGFPAIVGGWGPAGFVIPQSGSAPSCPH